MELNYTAVLNSHMAKSIRDLTLYAALVRAEMFTKDDAKTFKEGEEQKLGMLYNRLMDASYSLSNHIGEVNNAVAMEQKEKSGQRSEPEPASELPRDPSS